MTGLRGPVVVTGTDTGVGKTIVTAAVATAATQAGLRVAVLKPAQTGIWAAEAESDIDTVVRLAEPATALTLASYPDPLAPATAARVSGLPTVELSEAVDATRTLVAGHDLVLIEGAGGLLVPMGGPPERFWTVADLAGAVGAPAVVVARAGLGTLNHTALTREALARRNIEALLVIGAWPAQPDLVHTTNLADFAAPIEARLPDGAGSLPPVGFRRCAPSWLTARLHGTAHPEPSASVRAPA